MKYNDDGTYEDIVIKAVAPGRNSYSSSQQEVYSCSYVNGIDTKVNNITGTILWTNPNPTSNMTSGTITLSSDDYDMLEVYYKPGKTSNYIKSAIGLKGNSLRCEFIEWDGSALYNYYRNLTYVNDTSYSYTVAKKRNTDAPDALIPIYIIGYKTGLFN